MTTLFRKTVKNDILIVQVYFDDIIFCSTNVSLCKYFSQTMQVEFEMSMIGDLNFFIGIQINQSKDGVYVHQSKYTKELLSKLHMDDCKIMTTPMCITCNPSEEESNSKVC